MAYGTEDFLLLLLLLSAFIKRTFADAANALTLLQYQTEPLCVKKISIFHKGASRCQYV